ncbi:unnamed protein product [Brassica napus]|uniref:(rape) hypothetical protein n=1 Tax=Brassica napus TaxID=3708 RepID=A0A816L5E9_BRANA|nr:unnamed protein product [Brassica napus]
MASPVVRTHQKSVNSPTLVAATPGKEFGPKKNLAKELEKESGLKRTLDEEFGNVAFKWKEKAEVKKKAAEDKKKRLKLRKNRKNVAEAKKKEAELKKKQEAELKKQKQAGSKYKR